MNTRQIYEQWFEMNRAAIDPFMRWNEIALQAAERVAGTRQVYDQWFEISRIAVDPLMRWNEIALQAAERVAKYNLAVAQDCLEMGTRQIELNCETRDPDKWKDSEKKLISDFGQKIADRGADYLKLVKETQDALNEWASQAAKETAERAARAAESAARAGEEAKAAAGAGAQRGAKA
ncbi:phasin family protein [Methylocaldum szegediense]|uniref:Phasin protein n=1 Tax=Methylocaldum szegediense TaxID=73780 RepID=A0ABM9HYD0_9GAMM|nr:phasin family protein [Methylocaldum szegediense]CAI8759464.1 Phasin protein [Methylocaldum szegediense]